jgi:hypothetical protein
MKIFSQPGPDVNGYMPQHKALADALRAATTDEEADEIARRDGHRDAQGAVLWLEERS